MMRFFIVAVAFLLLRAAYYLYYWLLAKHFRAKYEYYLAHQDDDYIIQHKQAIIRMLASAGVKGDTLPVAQAVGYGQVATFQAPVLDNLDSLREDFVSIVWGRLREAPGTLKDKMLQTFNPFYWLEVFIFLPRTILGYLGVRDSSIFVNILQVIWWFISAASVIISLLESEVVSSWFRNIKI